MPDADALSLADPVTERTRAAPTQSLSALAMDVVAHARACPAGCVLVDATGDRLELIAEAAAGFDPGLDVLVLPAWDSLPYDRSPSSPAILGRRIATFATLAAAPGQPRLVITSARALMARVPPPGHWRELSMTLAVGDALDGAAFGKHLQAWGYVPDEHVDEPGQLAIRGHVLDIYPGDATTPFRMIVEGGVIQLIHRVDAMTQRSDDTPLDRLIVRTVLEVSPAAVAAGPAALDGLVCAMDYLQGAAALLHPEVETRWAELMEQVEDAHAATLRARRVADDGANYVPPPHRLFCDPAALAAGLAGLDASTMDGMGDAKPVAAVHRTAAAAAAVRAGLAHGRTVVAAGAGAHRLWAALSRRGEPPVRLATDWADATCGPVDTAAVVAITLESGFTRAGLTVIAAPVAAPHGRNASTLVVEEPPRFGDIVVHREHGICRMHGLREIAAEERVVLEFADDTELLVPVAELDQVWRYGSDAGPIALDRASGGAWHRRREEIAAEIADTARELAAASAARARLTAPAIHAPAAAFGRFNRRFSYALSPDQADTIDAVLEDLASGRPMDRLVCGDVGFGKTEVALRAAAAAALAGYQVAIIAPTTVLARQHFDTFTRRFAGMGVKVAAMLRGGSTAEGRDVRDALANGDIRIVVGTQSIAAEAIRFKNLALVVIDEEQRLGDGDKKRVSTLRNPEGGVHTLVMTATPIPRTLQSAMVGLREVSVIATPPFRRQPTRTFVLPWDPVVVREALMREHARGGQSFIVCPRIEDLPLTAARLVELAPELSVVTAHGRQKPAALEQMVAEFAAGQHDVLLATNIIEAGLDIPRANTILITRPDRFGLSQLHQMRGRVGRGERRGVAYLLTVPGKALPAATQRRLRTLEVQTQLGAGVAISLADMDARGAGDLFGERQAGHVRAIGTELYQHLLSAELAAARGEPRFAGPPHLHTGVLARIPADMVPEPNLRLQLYRQLARMAKPDEAVAFAEELADRFGELPDPVRQLLDLARLRAWCAANGVTRMDAGPQGVALTVDPARIVALVVSLPFGVTVKDNRLIFPMAVHDPIERLGKLCEAMITP